MMQLSYEQVVGKIKENSALSNEQIDSSINAKLKQFAGLVSREGAAHILANELGIKLATQDIAKLKIKDIMVGMQNLEVLTKVLAVFPVRQFNSNGRQGQVGSAVLGDETGTIRAVFWNEQANKLEFLSKGDVLKLKGVYVKENRNSTLELHFNNRSMMVANPPGESVEAQEFRRENPRRRINEIKDDDRFVEVYGTVTDVYDLRFYEVCGRCGKRAKPQDAQFVCPEHGAVSVNYSYVLNLFLDDGTASVRTVFFRQNAEAFLNKTSEEILAFREAPEAFEQLKNDSLGRFIRINARVNKNEMFNRVELIANEVEDAKPADVQPVLNSSQPSAVDGQANAENAQQAAVEENKIEDSSEEQLK
ncbi:hypothetical protein HYX10_01660 [Candidatus Woesearchaeota archaeon]|nr:hypothetical protein [Candidatus Woesearchaeota archaeon]